MRVGIWMFRGWMLASSGVFQPVVGMGEDWVAARGWRGSSGIESTSRTRMQPIYDGASGSSTGSDRLNLNQGLGVPSGKGKYQQGEPHIDTTSPLGADAYSAGESSAAPAQVNLALELGPPSGKRKAEPHNNSREAADTRLTLSLGGSRPLKLAKTDQGNGPGSWAWIQKCGSERITELQQWLDAILKQFSVPDGGEKRTLSPQSLEQISFMSSQVHCAIFLVIGLFQDKLRHLNDPGVDKILLQRNMNESGQRLLTSIAQIQMDSISRKSEVDFWKSPMLESSWYRMMMNLLSDFQTHEILLDTLLSDYLNQQTHGQIIWHYLNSISIPSVPTLYLNFDVKLSLLEDPSMEKYRNIFQMLNEETWKNIEAEHILYHSSYFTETNPYFEPVHSAFKKLAMKSRLSAESSSSNLMDGLFKELIDQIHLLTHVEIESIEDSNLITFRVKMVYDMLRFALHYHSKELSIPWTKETFYEIQVFEEAVGLLGSAAHTLHARAEDLFQFAKKFELKARGLLPKNIKGRGWRKGILNYLTDSNQNRKTSNLVVYFSNPEEEEVRLTMNPNYSQEPIGMKNKILSHYLTTGSEDLKKSSHKLIEQYKRYCNALELYKLHTINLYSSPTTHTFLDGGAWKIVQSELDKIEEPWVNYVVQRKTTP